ncbi:MAG: UDP-N-acetylmuramoyl-L-alanyl-D-glutamate--2,6-diaminopimelate ligase [Actinomyces urogenitalis]|uniref:Mur ligase family protein n=1 Tax=Actinomyces urogenitalis TaxID=103621 RepID=UPI00066058C3|nr:Mur ligase family protein [Actinomyces urogenitalis]MBS5976563.1 UDP-N-acetylmuramoyl-L-alanyl-D-glutamate--2,6-diaminopimelate ligase [Actinomyces urogenitalis]MBS6072137.1 UDP-N-acetylmuramoyl-L-alanyl-D-glutamate--2,6-diaminopimelate ligase [Actinomyces urogenitalis]
MRHTGGGAEHTGADQRQLSLAQAARVLYEAGILREVVTTDGWFVDPDHLPELWLSSVVYDTRMITPGALLVVKGRFKEDYLLPAQEQGMVAYVAEREYSSLTTCPGLIVTDALEAMSLLAAELYGHPERELTIVGITGTKGKTTTAHLVHAVLSQVTGGRSAMFSSNHLCLDGRTFTPAVLTTPESADSLRMMRQALDAGMTHLVMEVSSQAYKLKRVFGLTFDVGVFLNIGQDHISLVEHPTFEDYFFCKRELIRHSRQLVLNADTDYHGLLTEEARLAGARTLTVSREDGDLILTQEGEGFTLRYHGQEVAGSADQPMRLRLAGAFNQDNAAAAVAVALSLGSPAGSPQLRALEQVQVSGRMERLVSADGVVGYVDFAHNHLSTSSLLDEVERVYGRENPRIILVSGSTGGKAVNRRQGIVAAANGRVDSFIFTEDDQDRENATQIARQMRGYVTDTEASTQIVMPRAKAIEAAVAQAREYPGRRNVILVIGKGDEVYNVVNGVKQPYEGDAVVLRRLLG